MTTEKTPPYLVGTMMEWDFHIVDGVRTVFFTPEQAAALPEMLSLEGLNKVAELAGYNVHFVIGEPPKRPDGKPSLEPDTNEYC